MSKFITGDDIRLALQCLVYLVFAFAFVMGAVATVALALRVFQWVGGI